MIKRVRVYSFPVIATRKIEANITPLFPGSFDDYLLFTKDEDLDSQAGVRLKKQLKAAWAKKYGTRFSARRITFERKIAYLLLSGKINQEVYDKLLGSGDGVQLLPKSLSPLHVEKLKYVPQVVPKTEAAASEPGPEVPEDVAVDVSAALNAAPTPTAAT